MDGTVAYDADADEEVARDGLDGEEVRHTANNGVWAGLILWSLVGPHWAE